MDRAAGAPIFWFLGRFFGKFCKSFGCKILVYDPYKKINDKRILQVKKVDKLLKESDTISFHIHLDDKNFQLVNKKWFNKMKKNIKLINTSRGEIINEQDLLNFLDKNKKANYIADVISNEQNNKQHNKLFNLAKKTDQIILTPHIGGMTIEAQELAYNHATSILKKEISLLKK